MRKSAIIYKIFCLNYIFLLVSNLWGKYLDAAPIFIGYIYSLCQNGIKLRMSVAFKFGKHSKNFKYRQEL